MARASESEPAATLTWSDHLELARQLHARFPDLDPLTLRFPDLVRWVNEAPRFSGGAKPENPLVLEHIQRAWYSLYDAG